MSTVRLHVDSVMYFLDANNSLTVPHISATNSAVPEFNDDIRAARLARRKL